MLDQLKFSDTVYGLGAGIFFIGYFLFEVPSNVLMHRIGAKKTLARIMVLWACISACMALTKTPTQFYILRFLLGAAEAGFYPGIILYLTYWFPSHRRGQGQIDSCLRAAGLQDYELAVSDDEVRTFTGESARPTRWLPACQQPEDTQLVQAAVRAIAQAGRSPQVGSWAFCTNGSESAGRRRIPTIGLGPGCKEDAHTIDESIALEQLEGAREIHRNLVLEMA